MSFFAYNLYVELGIAEIRAAIDMVDQSQIEATL